MLSRPWMLVLAPLVAAPIVCFFLLVGGDVTESPPADRVVPRSTDCGPPARPCSTRFGLVSRPLEC